MRAGPVLNLAIDYDTLQRIGAIMGSGGMVVMDENNCMVEIARFFLSFTQSESCGKCAPCRLGTTQLLRNPDPHHQRPRTARRYRHHKEPRGNHDGCLSVRTRADLRQTGPFDP